MATILGNNTDERLGTSGMSSGNDRISASGGNDTVVYELTTAGGSDAYYGGTGVDALELRFTAAEWAIHSAKVLALQSSVAAAAKASASGAVAAGTKSGTLDFGSGKVLTVYEVESVKIYVDGAEYGVTPPPVNKAVSFTGVAPTGAVVENGVLTAGGTIGFTDADLADAHTVSFAPVAGALGTFALGNVSESATTADGSVGWTYSLNNASAAVQALAQGETITETYNVSVSDGKGSTATQAVKVTITGTNDAPVITSTAAAAQGAVVEAGTKADGTAVPGNAIASGQLASSDVDHGATAAWSAVGSVDGQYGSFSIDSQGHWTYQLDNSKADGLAQNQVVTETFTARVTDDKGATVDQIVTIKVTGTEDAAPILVADTGEVVEAGAGVTGPATAAGKIQDAGVPASAAWSVDADGVGTYGNLSVKNGVWTYTLDNANADTNALVDGDVKTETFTVQASYNDANGDPQIATHDVTVTVYGSNDKAAIVVDTESAQDLSVTEAGGLANVTDDNADAGGVLLVKDPDAGQSKLLAGTVAGTYGDFVISEDGVWSYALRNADTNVQHLTASSHVTDTAIVTSLDGSASYAITVNIDGADDQGEISVDPVKQVIEAKEAGGDNNGTLGSFGSIIVDDGSKDGITVKADAAGIFTIGNDPDGGSTGLKALTNVAPALVFEQDPVDPTQPFDKNGDGELTDADKHLAIVAGSSKGLYGDFTLDTSNGVWSYKINQAAADKLKDGELVTETLTVFGADGVTTQTITVNVTGQDDTPTVLKNTPIDSLVVEVNQAKEDPLDPAYDANYVHDDHANGTLLAVDPDEGPVSTIEVAASSSTAGKYGDFSLNDNGDGTATWDYVLNTASAATEALTSKDTKIEKMIVQSGGATQIVTVTVKGTDDAATFTDNANGTDDLEIVEAGGTKNDINLNGSASGAVKVADVDANQSSWAASSLKAAKGTYGDFTFALDKDSLGKAIPDTLTWKYTLRNGDANVQALLSSDDVTDQVVVTAADGTTHTITVNVHGTDDESTIAVVGTADVAVKEAGGVNNKTVGDAKASGQLSVTNPDGPNLFDDLKVQTGSAYVLDPTDPAQKNTTFDQLKATAATALGDGTISDGTVTAKGTVAGKFGTFSFDAVSGKWGYTLNDASPATQSLDAGQKAVDSLVVFSDDSTASYQITVNITGADDSAVISNVVDAGVDPTNVNSVQAEGVAKWDAVNKVLPTLALDADAGGKLGGYDADDGNPDAPGGLTPLTFVVPAAKAQVGVYGTFNVQADGTWTYHMADNATQAAAVKALVAGDLVTDKLTVVSATGGQYTLSVNVNGADDLTTVTTPASIDGTGKVHFTVADGDKGTLNLQLGTLNTDGTTKFTTYAATTVADGKDSVFTAPTTAPTKVTSGELYVTDNTSHHDPVDVGVSVTLGTNAGEKLDALTTVGTNNGAAMYGYGGNDTMTGSDSNDYLNGGTANDKLDGGAGDDILEGGAGNDVLTGGAGNDLFVFRATTDIGAANFDTIADFTSGDDHIQLNHSLLSSTYFTSKLNASGTYDITAAKAFTDLHDGSTVGSTVAKGAVSPDAWFRTDLTVTAAGKVVAATGIAKQGAEDTVVYDSATGTLWYDADGSGAGVAVKIAVLTDHPALHASDIGFI